MTKKKKRGSKVLKVILVLFVLIGAGGGYFAWDYYKMIYYPNVTLEGKETTYFYIASDATMDDVINGLYEKNYIINRNSFEWVAEKKNYRNHVHPGRYLLEKDMSNNELVDLLRSGEQEPVKVIFNNVRTKAELAGKISKNIEADSLEVINFLDHPDSTGRFGFNTTTIITMFLPNTYEMYWNTTTTELMNRMAKEYKTFWNEERVGKANTIGLSQSEVVTLASIVRTETNKADESPTIAGVYMNRLDKNIPLQADPTLIWAMGDFSIRRVLNVHKEIDSPYNTYKYTGLPPGPICLPPISYIDAVLNYEEHDYIYFCAKPDFSGYSNFAKTYQQHLINARAYQQALNKRGIYK